MGCSCTEQFTLSDVLFDWSCCFIYSQSHLGLGFRFWDFSLIMYFDSVECVLQLQCCSAELLCWRFLHVAQWSLCRPRWLVLIWSLSHSHPLDSPKLLVFPQQNLQMRALFLKPTRFRCLEWSSLDWSVRSALLLFENMSSGYFLFKAHARTQNSS